MHRCPLCHAPHPAPFARVQGRRYHACTACGLVAMVPEDRPARDAERAHYLTHENDPADAGYRAWLDRLARPLADRLAPGAEGLDYGAGPGPALARMLAERGFPTAAYDPFFAPDPAPLDRRYDFVTCTEAAEHFFDPAGEFARLDALVRPGGWLGLMTQPVRPGRAFDRWRYARDPTHVAFYRPRTLAWIAERHGWTLDRPRPDVALYHKSARPA